MTDLDKNTAQFTSTGELVELREQVTYLQCVLLKQKVMDQIRNEIWNMKSSEDMERILEAVQNGLRELDVAVYNCRVNLVDDRSEPPYVMVHAMTQEGSWIDFLDSDTDLSSVMLHAMNREGYWSESKEPGTDVIIKIWRSQEIAYRRDLEAEDLYSETLWPDHWTNLIRCALDVPFARGTLAVNSLKPEAFLQWDIEALQEMPGPCPRVLLAWRICGTSSSATMIWNTR